MRHLFTINCWMELIGGGGNKGRQSRHGTVSVTFCRLWRVINPQKIRQQTVCLLFSCQVVYLRSLDCCVLEVNGHNCTVDCCAEIATKYIDLQCSLWILTFVNCDRGFRRHTCFWEDCFHPLRNHHPPCLWSSLSSAHSSHTALQHFGQCTVKSRDPSTTRQLNIP